MSILDKDSKARMEHFINQHNDTDFEDEVDPEELFLDLCRVLVFMLLIFSILYGVWFN